MSEVFHGNPVDIHEKDCRHQATWDQAAVILIVFDFVQDAIPCVGHESLTDDKGVDTNGKD